MTCLRNALRLDATAGLCADDHCLETLYPPGMCGTFCNQHTYDCYVAEVHESCCDEEGQNCVAGVDIPRTCPVGCAIVFPEFLETCRDHVSAQEDLVEEDFEAFEEDCLSQDGLALVEYALSLVDSGCILDLSSDSGRRLQDSGYLTQWLDGRESKGQVDLAQLGGGLEEEGEAGSRVVGARDEVARAQPAHLTEGAQRVVGHVQPEDGK